MISWLLAIMLSYLFFSFSFLGDKLILTNAPRPKSYTFYIGILSALVIFLMPFIKLSLPSPTVFLWIILEALVFILGIYVMFVTLEKHDVSVVITTIGATQPIFIFILSLLSFGPQPILFKNIAAFILLLIGSVVISIDKKFHITGNYVKIILFVSLLFSLDYIFSKLVFLHQPFLQGFVWMRICTLVMVLTFLVSKKFRTEIFQKKRFLSGKLKIVFLCSQACGGIATLLQSFAIFLAPIALLPIMNALRGIQYVFLFILTMLLSLFLPKILKEDISKRLIVQKIISILLIGIGLAIVSFN